MSTLVSFAGEHLFIGHRTHVYPSPMGYWVDHYSEDLRKTEMQSTVMDDFGNLVDVLPAAHQRAAYRWQQH